jgi:hypothetical protein
MAKWLGGACFLPNEALAALSTLPVAKQRPGVGSDLAHAGRGGCWLPLKVA